VTTRFEPASRRMSTAREIPITPGKAPSTSESAGVPCEQPEEALVLDEAGVRHLARTGAVMRRCPACRKIADGFPPAW